MGFGEGDRAAVAAPRREDGRQWPSLVPVPENEKRIFAYLRKNGPPKPISLGLPCAGVGAPDPGVIQAM